MGKYLGFLLIAAAALTPPLAVAPGAEARRPAVAALDAIYDFYLGGIWVGDLTVDAVFGAETYRARAVLRTAGVIGFFFKARFEAEAEGKVGDDGLTPVRFSAESRDRKRRRRVEISFSDDGPVAMQAEPEFGPRPWRIAPGDQTGAADPLSAALAAFLPGLANEVCGQRAEVYDGERRFALEIGPPVRQGNRIHCDSLYIRVAGFKPKMMTPDRATRPFTLYFEERADGLFHVVRAVGETSFGPAILRLRE